MIKKKEHRDTDNRWLNTGIHANLDKFKTIKSTGLVKADDYVDGKNCGTGILVVHDFRQNHLSDDKTQTVLDTKSAGLVNETTVSKIDKNDSMESNLAQGLIVRQVLNKAISNQDFWLELLENGSAALVGFKLSNEAKSAIASGDVKWVNKNTGDIPEREKAFLYSRLEREAW